MTQIQAIILIFNFNWEENIAKCNCTIAWKVNVLLALVQIYPKTRPYLMNGRLGFQSIPPLCLVAFDILIKWAWHTQDASDTIHRRPRIQFRAA